MSKIPVIAVMLLLLSYRGSGQNGHIAGKVTDSSGKLPLALSTVSVFKAKDTVLITYRLSGEKGDFKIAGLPFDIPLRVLVSFSGYEAYRKEITLTAAKPSIELGSIQLNSTSKELEEVIVIAERPPVTVRKDTIEFNANSFKTLPNAVVEDLLRKLPGVEVDADGSLTVNGKRVNRITIDGKQFFGGDTRMATKNLPSTFIDKVQVLDDKDEIAQKNDGDLSDVGKVINLTIKKSVKKKWFGRVFAGIGTDDRYEAGANLNTLKDTFQVSFNGAANNNNRGVQRQGLTNTQNAGINLNYAPSNKLSFSGQYNYNRGRTNLYQVRNVLRFLEDTSINTHTTSHSLSGNSSHHISANGNWRKDSLTNMDFRLSFSFNGSDNFSPSHIVIDNNILGPLSEANSLIVSDGSSQNLNQSFSFSRRSKKKRSRNYSFSENFSLSRNPNSTTTESFNDYFYPSVSQQHVSQLRNTQSPSVMLSLQNSYSEDFGKKWVLRANNRLEYNQNTQDLFTYSKPVNSHKYDSLNYSLSSHLQRKNIIFDNMVGIGYRIKKLTISLNAKWQQQWVNNRFDLSGTVAKQFYSNIFPSLTANWNRFNLTISRNMTIPGIGYLNPVPNNSNPYYISYGNPYLLPSRSTSFNFNGYIYKVKSSVNLNTAASMSFVDNAIIQTVVMNNNGVQESRPVNVNGTMNANVYVFGSKQFRYQQQLLVSVNFGASGSYNRSPIFYNGVQSTANTIQVSPSLSVNLDWSERVQFAPRYTPSYMKSRYSNKQFSDREVITHNFTSQLTVRPIKKIIIESSLSYRYNGQVSAGLPKSNVYWSGSLSTLMLRDSKGQLKLEVFDILNRNNSFSSYISANSIVDSETNVLQRFFILSFIYNLRPSGTQGRANNTNSRVVSF